MKTNANIDHVMFFRIVLIRLEALPVPAFLDTKETVFIAKVSAYLFPTP